jgi:hypothetical protein
MRRSHHQHPPRRVKLARLTSHRAVADSHWEHLCRGNLGGSETNFYLSRHSSDTRALKSICTEWLAGNISSRPTVITIKRYERALQPQPRAVTRAQMFRQPWRSKEKCDLPEIVRARSKGHEHLQFHIDASASRHHRSGPKRQPGVLASNRTRPVCRHVHGTCVLATTVQSKTYGKTLRHLESLEGARHGRVWP